jgi:hypothetical protein
VPPLPRTPSSGAAAISFRAAGAFGTAAVMICEPQREEGAGEGAAGIEAVPVELSRKGTLFTQSGWEPLAKFRCELCFVRDEPIRGLQRLR